MKGMTDAGNATAGQSRFNGIFTPLITPIDDQERIDLRSLERLVRWQISEGIGGLWVMGTSAEFAAFEAPERAEAARVAVAAAAGRVPVIVNVSDASTRLAIRHAHAAREAGANAIAATPPYYYPHTQDELLAHYRKLRDAVDLPLFLYNIPQTVRVKLDLATACALAREGTVAGIKDSQNDLEWFRQLVLLARRESLPFAAFAGTRHLIDAAVLAGADGAIPSVANAFPALCTAVYDAATAGEYARASRLQTAIVDVESASGTLRHGSRNAQVLGVVKGVLAARGIIDHRGLTAPLRTPDPEEWERVRSLLPEGAGLTGV